ncbi:hypothetical protein [Amantichitinum ursilacus]|uniref:Uncharacterized protein n=1 Tax=Amantichitinum ursilacus TaxID=857265 RepID=A0A0N0XK40_9NEIS|nr:hypothetical protein [Amantichitinum ursilacus]KPC51961.1 hypothetical protein WG78_14880 [Amantichitinum ursilacus]
MQATTRFRMTDSASIHKQVLRVPAAIIEHLVQQAKEEAAFGIRWLHSADIAALHPELQRDGQRLVGMYVRMDQGGVVTDIGMRKQLH